MEVVGRSSPWWHVQQVTTCAPPKFCLLMAVTISTILRAVRFLGLLSVTQSMLSVPAPGWQLEQSYPTAAVMTPIAPRKSLGVSPFNVAVVTFLKYSPEV